MIMTTVATMNVISVNASGQEIRPGIAGFDIERGDVARWMFSWRTF